MGHALRIFGVPSTGRKVPPSEQKRGYYKRGHEAEQIRVKTNKTGNHCDILRHLVVSWLPRLQLGQVVDFNHIRNRTGGPWLTMVHYILEIYLLPCWTYPLIKQKVCRLGRETLSGSLFKMRRSLVSLPHLVLTENDFSNF